MVKKVIAQAIAKIGVANATRHTRINCPWIHYQPKEPEQLMRSREKNQETKEH